MVLFLAEKSLFLRLSRCLSSKILREQTYANGLEMHHEAHLQSEVMLKSCISKAMAKKLLRI